jgi:hypothetical protein
MLFKRNLTLASIRRNDEEIPVLHRLGRRRRHDPRIATGAEEHTHGVHEFEARDVRPDACCARSEG